ncbi:MAG: GDP-L-fucose synthase [Chlamydiales bacterium]|nr:GDP-L-fucose synthase [Chlamydiales bacterium]MCH9619484.1 GDP-L-fucose synthase [Chlamydiales bacterium]MCH9622288.1 GDP-L-fucose synthase [Chlamydiales bacterium]
MQPKRVVILGAGGVIGKSLISSFKGSDILPLTRQEIDLSQKASVEQLKSILQPTDAVVFLATITPDRGRGADAFMKNLEMVYHFCHAMEDRTIAHLVYMSSDTVYSINNGPITEETPTHPDDLYGTMHLAREQMLKAVIKSPLAILRSTLIYSENDTHNSYGPNRMRRVAAKEKKITLFGEGEEMRDHISVSDVASLTELVLCHSIEGELNIATGSSISYADLAKKVASNFEEEVEIVGTPRQNPITHRHFDVTKIYKLFPTFSFCSLDEGLAQVHREEFELVTKG